MAMPTFTLEDVYGPLGRSATLPEPPRPDDLSGGMAAPPAPGMGMGNAAPVFSLEDFYGQSQPEIAGGAAVAETPADERRRGIEAIYGTADIAPPTRLPVEYQMFGVTPDFDRAEREIAERREQQIAASAPEGGYEALLQAADDLSARYGQHPRLNEIATNLRTGNVTVQDASDLKYFMQQDAMQSGVAPSELSGPEWDYLDFFEKQGEFGAHLPEQPQLDPSTSKLLANMEQLRENYKPTAADATQFLPWNPLQAAELYDTYQSAERIEAGEGTDLDYRRVAQMLVREELLGDRSIMQTAGDIVLEAPSFMAEFAATGAAYGSVKKAAQKGLGRAVERRLASLAKQKVAGIIGQKATGLAGQAVQGVVGTSAGLTAQTAANPHLVAESAARRMIGDYGMGPDEANDLRIIIERDGDGFVSAMGKGFLDSAIELGTERMGAGLAQGTSAVGKAVGAAMDKKTFTKAIKAAVVRRVLERSQNPGLALKALKTSGFHGMVPEMLEERAGDVARGLTGVEDNYGATGKLVTGDFKWSTDDPTVKQLAAEAVAFAAIGAGGRAIDFATGRGPGEAEQPTVDPQQPLGMGQPSPAAPTGTVPPVEGSMPAAAAQPQPQPAAAPVPPQAQQPPPLPPRQQASPLMTAMANRDVRAVAVALFDRAGAADLVRMNPEAAAALAANPSRKQFASTLRLPEAEIGANLPKKERDRIAANLRAALEATSQTQTQPAPTVPPTPEPTLGEALGQMGAALGDNLRDAIWESVSQGKGVPVQERDSAVGRFVTEAMGRGYSDRDSIMSAIDTAATINNAGTSPQQKAAALNTALNRQFPVQPPQATPARPTTGVEGQPTAALPPRQLPITREDVQKVFRGATVEDLADIPGWRVRFKNGAAIDVRVDEKIEVPDRAKLEQRLGKPISDARWSKLQEFGAKGAFRLHSPSKQLELSTIGLIRLSSKRSADWKTLRHEAVHFAKQAGMFNEKEWGTLVRKYSSPDRDVGQQEEDIATASRAWGEGGVLASKVRKFARQTLKGVGVDPDAETIESLLETAEFWSRPVAGRKSAEGIETPQPEPKQQQTRPSTATATPSVPAELDTVLKARVDMKQLWQTMADVMDRGATKTYESWRDHFGHRWVQDKFGEDVLRQAWDTVRSQQNKTTREATTPATDNPPPPTADADVHVPWPQNLSVKDLREAAEMYAPMGTKAGRERLETLNTELRRRGMQAVTSSQSAAVPAPKPATPKATRQSGLSGMEDVAVAAEAREGFTRPVLRELNEIGGEEFAEAHRPVLSSIRQVATDNPELSLTDVFERIEDLLPEASGELHDDRLEIIDIAIDNALEAARLAPSRPSGVEREPETTTESSEAVDAPQRPAQEPQRTGGKRRLEDVSDAEIAASFKGESSTPAVAKPTRARKPRAAAKPTPTGFGRAGARLLGTLASRNKMAPDDADFRDMVEYLRPFYEQGRRGEAMGQPPRHRDDAVAAYEAGKKDSAPRKPVASKAAVQARQDAVDAAKVFADLVRNKIGMNPSLDPELISAAADLTVKAVRAGILTFRDYVRFLSDTIGASTVRRVSGLLEDGWERVRADFDTEMDAASDIAAILAEQEQADESAESETDGETGAGDDRPADRGRRGRREEAGGVGTGDGGRSGAAGRRKKEGGDAGRRPAARQAKRTGDGVPARNVRLSAEDVGAGGPKTKYRNNVAAIRLLKQIRGEGRSHATPEEQQVLAKYVGWGMFPGVFNDLGGKAFADLDADVRAEQDPNKWAAERDEVKELLTPEEWESAADSTINAHFTSPQIVEGIWQMLDRMGFRGGRTIETSAGIGNFIGLQPSKLHGHSEWTAVELDKLTGDMLRLLYPDANVQVKGYQAFDAPDNFFDLAVSNVPFSDSVKILSDSRYKSKRPNLHDYFFLKTVDKVRPGGLVAFITSTGTLDKQSPVIRRALAEKADLVTAFRLPENTFGKNAGTAVVTDLIVLRRRPDGSQASGPDWLKLATVPDPAGGADIPINEYYATHPSHVLGTVDRLSRMYGKGQPHVSRTDDFEQRWQKAIQGVPKGAFQPAAKQERPEPEQILLDDSKHKEGQYVVRGDKLFQVESGALVEQPEPEPHPTSKGTTTRRRNEHQRRVEHVRDVQPVREALIQRINGMLGGVPAPLKADHQQALRTAYEAFVKRHGPINAAAVKKSLAEDVDWPILASLEVWNATDQKAERLADIFDRDTIRSRLEAESAQSVDDAMALVLDESARLDVDRMADLLDRPVAEVERELTAKKLAFNDPSAGWVTADQYLSGNVRQKLRDARAAAEQDEQYRPNIAALEGVQPKDVPAEQIVVRPGAPWLPTETMAEFAASVTGGSPEHFDVKYVETSGEYIVRLSASGERALRDSPALNEIWGTGRADFIEILDAAMSGVPIVVRDAIKGPSGTSYVVNAEATEAANEKIIELKEEFEDWIWSDPQRRAHLAEIYNNRHRAVVNPSYDGSHLSFPGMLSPGSVLASTGRTFGGLRTTQKNAVWRTILRGKGVYAHEVGTGKTMTMVAAAMEMKRLGLAHKPAIIVPDSRAEATVREARDLYQGARILSASRGMNDKQRRQTVAKIASGDWDIVILTHPNLMKIPVSRELQEEYLQEQLDELRELVLAEGVNPDSDKEMQKAQRENKAVKRLRQMILKTREQIGALAEEGRDAGTTFEESGIDFLFVDEAHEFKSLSIRTRMGNIKGVPTGGADRAMNLEMIATYLQRRHNGRGLVLATGTPITNSMAELYVMQRLVQRNELEQAGLLPFDAWANTFGETVTKHEFDHKGSYSSQTRFSKFVNVEDLQLMAMQDIDVVRVENDPALAQALNRPERADREEVIPGSEAQKAYLLDLGRRAEALKNKPPEAGGDNHLVIASDGTKSATDMRLVGNFEEDDDTKAKRLVRNVIEINKQHPGTTQMVFIEAGRSQDPAFDLVQDIIAKLVAAGIPRGKILNFRGVAGEQKDKLIQRLKTGDAIVAIGGTKTLGTGVNAQDKLKAVHHLEPSWTPEAIEQRNGRAWRQGNENEEISVITYLTAGTLDTWRWQTVARKDAFIKQFFLGTNVGRSMEDDDVDDVGGFERMQVLSSGNPLLFERLNLQNDVGRLERSKQRHDRQRRRLRDEVRRLEKDADHHAELKQAIAKDWEHYQSVRDDEFSVTTEAGETLTDRQESAAILRRLYDRVQRRYGWHKLGEYRGFEVAVYVNFSPASGFTPSFHLKRGHTYSFSGAALKGESDPVNVWASIDANLRGIERRLAEAGENIEKTERAIKSVQDDIARPWRDAERFDKRKQRLSEVERLLADDLRGDETAAEQAQREADEKQRESEQEGQRGFLGLGGARRPRTGKVPDVVQAQRPEVEQQLLDARGMPPATTLARVKEWFTSQWNRATRPQEFIPRTGEFGTANEVFRLLKSIADTASDETMRTLSAIVDDLSEEQYALFERAIVIRNLLDSIERGEPVQFGFRDRAEVDEYHQQLLDAIELTPEVEQALEKRTKIVREFVAELVEYDILPDAAIGRAESYYHQQVLAHAQAQRAGRRSLIRKKQGFQRERMKAEEVSDSSRLIYNTDYFEAEATWMTQARLELAKEKLLENLEKRYDQTASLKEAAKRQNFEELVGGEANAKQVEALRKAVAAAREAGQKAKVRQLSEDLKALDPTHVFRQKIARNGSRIRDMIRKGDVNMSGAPSQPRTAINPGADQLDRTWFRLLAWLARERGDEPAGIAAKAIFKAMAEREDLIRETLGAKYATWQQLADRNPKLDVWQPEPGNLFYRAVSVPEEISSRLQQGIINEHALTRDQLRQVVAIGGPRRQMVLPNEIVQQLRLMDRPSPSKGIEALSEALMRGWRTLMLFIPKRAAGYMLRNVTGDVDVVLAGAPQLSKFVPQAEKEIRNYYARRLGLSKTLRSARDLAVVSSSMTAKEIPDLKKIPAIKRLYESRSDGVSVLNAAPMAVIAYFDAVRGFNEYRESVLRYAAFLYYRDALENKKLKHYGGANRVVVDALAKDMGNDVAAAHLARNILGDYGDLTVMGDYIRKHIYPFWSWNEIQFKRYPRLVVNAVSAGQKGRGVATGAVGATVLLSRLGALYAAAWLWNNLMFPDDEEELDEYSRRTPHLIFGRNSDGSINVFRNIGALGDILEWFGINEVLALWPQYAEGQISGETLAKQAVKAPANKLVGGLRPDVKGLFEVGAGISTFPDFFNPRSVERDEAAARIVAAEDEWRAFKGMVLKEGDRARPHYWTKYLVGVSDPKRNAMNSMYDLRDKYLDSKGKESQKGLRGFRPFRLMREAAYADDYEAFVEAKKQFMAAGKSFKNFEDSLETLDPIASRLSEADEQEFEREFLNDLQRQKLKVARDYAGDLQTKLWHWWKTDSIEHSGASGFKGEAAAQARNGLYALTAVPPQEMKRQAGETDAEYAARKKTRQAEIDDARKYLDRLDLTRDEAKELLRQEFNQRTGRKPDYEPAPFSGLNRPSAYGLRMKRLADALKN